MSHAHAHGPTGWDDHAQSYDVAMAHLEPALQGVTAALLDAVGAAPGKRILDLACGPGNTTAAAAQRGASALGIDLSGAMVQAARRRFPHVQFALGDMLAPPAGPWDGIVCRFGGHHVDPAWIEAAYRSLGAGGRLALAELGATDADAEAKGMRGPDHWVRLLRGAGFRDVEVGEHRVDLAQCAAGDPVLSGIVGQGYGRQFEGPVYVVAGRKGDG